MQRLSYPSEPVLSIKITRNIIVLSFKDSPRKPLGRRPQHRGMHAAGNKARVRVRPSVACEVRRLVFSPITAGMGPTVTHDITVHPGFVLDRGNCTAKLDKHSTGQGLGRSNTALPTHTLGKEKGGGAGAHPTCYQKTSVNLWRGPHEAYTVCCPFENIEVYDRSLSESRLMFRTKDLRRETVTWGLSRARAKKVARFDGRTDGRR